MFQSSHWTTRYEKQQSIQEFRGPELFLDCASQTVFGFYFVRKSVPNKHVHKLRGFTPTLALFRGR